MIVSDELMRSSVAGSCALGSSCRCLEGVCAGQRQVAEGAQISATPAAMLGESSALSRTGTWGKDKKSSRAGSRGHGGHGHVPAGSGSAGHRAQPSLAPDALLGVTNARAARFTCTECLFAVGNQFPDRLLGICHQLTQFIAL